MPSVPFFRPSITDEDIQGVTDSLRSGWLARGQQCAAFEGAFADYVGAAHAVTVNGCTTALVAALKALNIGPGDLVVTPALTFVATAAAVHAVGATPLLVDCSAESLLIDLDAARAALIAERQRNRLRPAAIIPVHFGGNIVDPPRLAELAAEFGLEIVHDAAHCTPSAWRADAQSPWVRIGELPGVACFSFYANKTITTGEGGMLTTNDAALATRVRRLTGHGIAPAPEGQGAWSYEVPEFGLRGSLADPLAALGLSQLRRADDLWRRRQAVAQRYRERLGAHLPCTLPLDPPNVLSSWHLFTLFLKLEQLSCGRDEIFRRLSDMGVHCSVHYRPAPLHAAVAQALDAGTCLAGSVDKAVAVWPRLLSLPIYPDLSREAQDYVCDCLEQVLLGAMR